MKLHFCRSGIFLGVKFQKYRQDGLPARVAWMEKLSFFLHHKDLKNYYFEKIQFEEQKENLKKKEKIVTKMGTFVFD